MLVRQHLQIIPVFSPMIQCDSKLITITSILLLFQLFSIQVNPKPTWTILSLVWLAAAIDSFTRTVHLLSNTPWGFQQLWYMLIMSITVSFDINNWILLAVESELPADYDVFRCSSRYRVNYGIWYTICSTDWFNSRKFHLSNRDWKCLHQKSFNALSVTYCETVDDRMQLEWNVAHDNHKVEFWIMMQTSLILNWWRKSN